MPIGHHLRLMAISVALGVAVTNMSLGVELTVTDSGNQRPRPSKRARRIPARSATSREFRLVDYPDPVDDPAPVDYPDPFVDEGYAGERAPREFETVENLPQFDAKVDSEEGAPFSQGLTDEGYAGGGHFDAGGGHFDASYGGDCQGCHVGCGSTDPFCACCGCGTGCGCCGDCVNSKRGRFGFFVDLWLAQGITGNADDPINKFNLPVTFNDRAGEYQMNQLYLSFGRAVRRRPSAWDVGGRIDLLYGTDYFFTTAIGLETRSDGSPKWNSSDGPRGAGAALYGLAMPQAYAEVYAPVLGGVNVMLGHFYTPLAYEDVRAPRNFFYSHSYTRQYGQPFTHTGVLSNFALGPNAKALFGVTRGWDTWEDPNDKPGYLAGLKFCARQRTSLAFALHTGREDDEGLYDRTVYSMILTQRVSPALTYVLEHNFGMESLAEFDDQSELDDAKWYSLCNYLYWDVSEALAMGLRVEWFRDQDNARVLGIPLENQVDGGNYTQVTLGVNWKPTTRLLVRPEVRWDTSDVSAPNLGVDGMFIDFTKDNQFTFGTDVIFRL